MGHHRRFQSRWPKWMLELAVMVLVTAGGWVHRTSPPVRDTNRWWYACTNTPPTFFPLAFFFNRTATLLSSIVAPDFCQNPHGNSPLFMYALHQLVLRLVTINPLDFYHFSLDYSCILWWIDHESLFSPFYDHSSSKFIMGLLFFIVWVQQLG